MDDLIGLILFAVIAGMVWLANKIKEAQESRGGSPPPTGPEDLPERTRQMLYGGDVPMAKPKQPQAHDRPRPVPPKPLPPGQREATPRQAPRRQVVGGRPVAAPPPPAPPSEELSPRALRVERERQAPPHAHEPGHDLTPHELRELRRLEAARRRGAPPEAASPRQQQAAREQQRLAQERQRVLQQTKQLEQRARQPQQARRDVPAAAAPARAERRIGTWLGDAADVRRGIVLAEILGPPKGVR